MSKAAELLILFLLGTEDYREYRPLNSMELKCSSRYPLILRLLTTDNGLRMYVTYILILG